MLIGYRCQDKIIFLSFFSKGKVGKRSAARNHHPNSENSSMCDLFSQSTVVRQGRWIVKVELSNPMTLQSRSGRLETDFVSQTSDNFSPSVLEAKF